MAYDTNWKLKAEFNALLQPWLDQHDLTHYDWQQIHWALDGLRYLATVKREYPKVDVGLKEIQHVNCTICGRSSVRPDACVINFARIGGEPQWYCRDHYPEAKGLLPAGWHPPETVRVKLDAMRMTAWHKLTPEERALMNRNIVQVASSGE